MAKSKAKPETWLHNNDKLLKIQKWCRDGLTNKQMAEAIGISYTTFKRWLDLEVVPEETDLPYRKINFKGLFGDFLVHAREVDEEIIGALRMAALGYWVEEQYMNKKGKPVKVRRWIPPSDKALALWLKNRLPSDWNKENQGAIENIEAQEQLASDFFVKQKIQVDELQKQDDEEVLTDANNE